MIYIILFAVGYTLGFLTMACFSIGAYRRGRKDERNKLIEEATYNLKNTPHYEEWESYKDSK